MPRRVFMVTSGAGSAAVSGKVTAPMQTKRNLIALPDQTYPGVNNPFDSPVPEDDSQKWVDLPRPFGMWTVYEP